MSPEEHMQAVLDSIGFSADPETATTAKRFVELLEEFSPDNKFTGLDFICSESKDPLILREIPFHSLCAHHLLPFIGNITIVISPRSRLAGLGGIVRLVQNKARKPQVQERLAQQIADNLLEILDARAVGVLISARHMCMEMRGCKSQALVETIVWRGSPDKELKKLLTPT